MRRVAQRQSSELQRDQSVPTIAFEQLFAFLVLGHGRRQLLWFVVKNYLTAEWLARQINEAFPWDTAPAYIVRDNDRAFGSVFRRRIRITGTLGSSFWKRH